MNRLIAIFDNTRPLAALVALASLGILCAAWISQYGFHMDPCQLCFYQRKPYMVNIALGIAAFLLAPKNRKAALGVLFLAALAFVVDAGIAGFHVGVEQHWWKGLESCSNYAMPEHATAAEMLAFIKSRAPVRCDVPAFVLFGISMAGYNFLLATGMACVTFFFTGRQWRRK
jgi:disulfide bond formation protein DsbB